MKVFFSCFKHWSYDFHLVARYLFEQEKCLISSHFSLKLCLQNLTPNRPINGRFLNLTKFIYAQTMNSEQGDKPLFLDFDLASMVGLYSIAFRLRSRRPVLALLGLHIHHGLICKSHSYLH